MSSQAQTRFAENRKDVERLLKIHTDLVGDLPGRKYGVEVLNKSAIILICSFWEAYIEDICKEAISSINANLADYTKLPKEPQKLLAGVLKADKNDLAVWKLAGNGWKSVLEATVQSLTDGRAGLNTPKHDRVQDLFKKALGILDITTTWNWQKMSVTSAKSRLDDFITLRGAIAHRGQAGQSVTKKNVTDFLTHVDLLIEKTDECVRSHVQTITGINPY